MYPYHDRLFFRRHVIRFPHVQIQAVLILAGAFSVVLRLIYPVIWNNVNGSFPAKFPHRLFANKRDSLVRNDSISFFADKSPVHTFDRKRLVIIPVSDSLVFANCALRASFTSLNVWSAAFAEGLLKAAKLTTTRAVNKRLNAFFLIFYLFAQ